MRRLIGAGATGAILAAIAVPAAAHHSGAMFDATKTIEMTGTVKEFDWENPHAWLHVVVPASGGKANDYSIELSSVNIIARKGWNKTVVKPGDKLTISVHPMRDGSMSGLLLTAKLPDGKVLTDHDY